MSEPEWEDVGIENPCVEDQRITDEVRSQKRADLVKGESLKRLQEEKDEDEKRSG